MTVSTTLALVLSTMLTAPAGPPAPSMVTTPAPTEAAAIAGTEPRPTVTAPRLDPMPRSSRWKAKRLSPKERKGARSMIGLGAGLFGLFYLTSTMAAALELDEVREDGVIEPQERDTVRTSHLMFIPVAGPFVAAPLGESGKEKAALVGLGVMQAVTATCMTAGIVQLVRDQRARRWELSAAPAPGGGMVGLRGRF